VKRGAADAAPRSRCRTSDARSQRPRNGTVSKPPAGEAGMPSVVGLPEERELDARRRVDGLRKEADRIQAELVAAEQEWQEPTVTRRWVDTILSLGTDTIETETASDPSDEEIPPTPRKPVKPRSRAERHVVDLAPPGPTPRPRAAGASLRCRGQAPPGSGPPQPAAAVPLCGHRPRAPGRGRGSAAPGAPLPRTQSGTRAAPVEDQAKAAFVQKLTGNCYRNH
jgi:hypothetical protein